MLAAKERKGCHQWVNSCLHSARSRAYGCMCMHVCIRGLLPMHVCIRGLLPMHVRIRGLLPMHVRPRAAYCLRMHTR